MIDPSNEAEGAEMSADGKGRIVEIYTSFIIKLAAGITPNVHVPSMQDL